MVERIARPENPRKVIARTNMDKPTNYRSFEEKVEKILQEYTLIPHTRSSRLYSTVRRMKAEKELSVPIDRRAGFVISTKTSHRASEMDVEEWEAFYTSLCNEMKTEYPDIYQKLFDQYEKFCGRCASKLKDHYSGWWMACGGLYGKKV